MLLLLAILAVAWVLVRRRRGRHLKEQFGSEYERTVQQTGDRKAAEEQLEQRLRRVRGFDLRELGEDERRRFQERWTRIQSAFVDDPVESLLRADALLVEAMCACGYDDAGEGPVTRVEDLSVMDAERADEYRRARRIVEGNGSTEELRQAMRQIHRVLDRLLEPERSAERPSTDGHVPMEAR